jgi:prolyl-tRNA synthetase
MLHLKDRHERDFIIGPTHEEVITDIVRRKSELQAAATQFLPIQTKFRDEIRPRFGVMRAREFVMKDIRSTDEAMLRSYQVVVGAYVRIFTDGTGFPRGRFRRDRRCNVVRVSVLADSGEDAIARIAPAQLLGECREGGGACAGCVEARPRRSDGEGSHAGKSTCEEVAELLHLPPRER